MTPLVFMAATFVIVATSSIMDEISSSSARRLAGIDRGVEEPLWSERDGQRWMAPSSRSTKPLRLCPLSIQRTTATTSFTGST